MTKTFTTPKCMVCKNSEIVEMTEEEFSSFTNGLGLMVSFPERDADFRELVKTGTHPECWDKIFADDE